MKISLQRRHALMVEVGAFSHKIDYVIIFKEIWNPEGHPNCITGSKVTAILMNGWILPIGGASAVKGLHLQPAQQACSELIPPQPCNTYLSQRQENLFPQPWSWSHPPTAPPWTRHPSRRQEELLLHPGLYLISFLNPHGLTIHPDGKNTTFLHPDLDHGISPDPTDWTFILVSERTPPTTLVWIFLVPINLTSVLNSASSFPANTSFSFSTASHKSFPSILSFPFWTTETYFLPENFKAHRPYPYPPYLYQYSPLPLQAPISSCLPWYYIFIDWPFLLLSVDHLPSLRQDSLVPPLVLIAKHQGHNQNVPAVSQYLPIPALTSNQPSTTTQNWLLKADQKTLGSNVPDWHFIPQKDT